MYTKNKSNFNELNQIDFANLTPMMQQYISIKNNHIDTLLLYRMGDFYELFYGDAEIVSRELNLVLTNRGEGTPMCGIPFHALDNYLPRLVRAGYKVAVCEQLETPTEAKKRGYKSVVRREVVRIVTPGTIVDEHLLDGASNNYLAAIFFAKKNNFDSIIKKNIEKKDSFLPISQNKSSLNELTDRAQNNSQYSWESQSPNHESKNQTDDNDSFCDPIQSQKEYEYNQKNSPQYAEYSSSVSSPLNQNFVNPDLDQENKGNSHPDKDTKLEKSTPVSIAWADISTGDFMINTVELGYLADELYRIMPQEVIVPDEVAPLLEAMVESKVIGSMTRRPEQMFCYDRVKKNINNHYGVSFVEGFGDFSQEEMSAAGALLEYINYTQRDLAPLLKRPRRVHSRDYVQIDRNTRRGLELCLTIRGEHGHTLFSVLNFARTSFGRRLLKNNIIFPLTNVAAIEERLDNVEWFVKNGEIREELRLLLHGLPDLERIIVKISTKRYTIKDLWALRNAFGKIFAICEILYCQQLTPGLSSLRSQLGGVETLRDELEKAIKADAVESDGVESFINPDYDIQLAVLYDRRRAELKGVENLIEKYRRLTGVDNIKIQHNNIIGYYVEVSARNSKELSKAPFIHKQSLSNCVRYKTDELQQLEHNILRHNEGISSLEGEIVSRLGEKVMKNADTLGIIAFALAKIDVSCALAHAAQLYNYSRPNVDNSMIFNIVDGRHPIVETSIEGFTPNTCELNNYECGEDYVVTSSQGENNLDQLEENKNENNNRITILTGPNMAGKSTFLRQNALITIMAQMGSFVPAFSAQIGVVDAIFSRIGSADDIARGQSTFMVEMLETANILNNATERSMLILDEVGRGTSTYDGLAIAYAILWDIHTRIKARTIFATHYHELSEVVEDFHRCRCYHLEIVEIGEKIFFNHKVKPGHADRSYGIHVAALAGMPYQVVQKAKTRLQELLGGKV